MNPARSVLIQRTYSMLKQPITTDLINIQPGYYQSLTKWLRQNKKIRLPSFLIRWRLLLTTILALCSITANTVAALPAEIIEQYRQPVSQWPAFEVDAGVNASELGKLPPIPKPQWQTEAMETLGKTLFFDPRLSKSGQIACASCHEPELGWGDGRRVAIGHNRASGKRNTMGLANVAYFKHFFWDGRASSLEEQALGPITNPLEMNADISDVITTLNAIPAYKPLFIAAFGTEAISKENLARALAAFQRTIVSRRSRFDRFVDGNYRALSDQQIEGLHLFRTQARCMNCHNGPLFSDGQFHNIGLSYAGKIYEDFGRALITGLEEDGGRFRTPSLRDVTFTGPWMHNGLFKHLKGILRTYNAGIIGNRALRPNEPPLSPLIKPLKLNAQQLHSLEAFLQSLSQRASAVRLPELPGAATDIDNGGSNNSHKNGNTVSTVSADSDHMFETDKSNTENRLILTSFLSENSHQWIFATYIPLFLCSLIGLALILERCFFLFRQPRLSGTEKYKLLALFQQQKFNEGQKLLEALRPFYIDAISAVYSARSKAKTIRDETAATIMLPVTERLKAHLSGLITVSALAPMFGLLGTVIGLMHAFREIGLSHGPVEPALVADGLWQALFTTAIGLMIAAVCIFSHALISAKVKRDLAEAKLVLNQFSLGLEDHPEKCERD